MATSKDDELRRHEKVVAAVDLPGAPAGTRGKVMLVNGFEWIRYRVHFENGAEYGPIDRDQLVRAKEYDRGREGRGESGENGDAA